MDLPNVIHLTFIFVSVFELRHQHLLLELLYILLASISCYYIGVGFTATSPPPSPTTTPTPPTTPTPSTPNAPNNTTTSLPNTTPGIQILQARYGTTKKDIDVTQLIQAMVVQDPHPSKQYSLSIDKTFNFNKAFTDPAKFRRKYLRLVALVDGEAYINNIYELRTADFSLKSGRGAVDKEVDAKKMVVAATSSLEHEQRATNHEETTTPPNDASSNTIAATTSNCHPVIANIAQTYQSMSDIPFQNEKIETICISAELIAEFISLFGTSFLPVRANVTDNVRKIRAKVELILVQNSELSMSTIGEYIGK
jgi:hypothetical protein